MCGLCRQTPTSCLCLWCRLWMTHYCSTTPSWRHMSDDCRRSDRNCVSALPNCSRNCRHLVLSLTLICSRFSFWFCHCYYCYQFCLCTICCVNRMSLHCRHFVWENVIQRLLFCVEWSRPALDKLVHAMLNRHILCRPQALCRYVVLDTIEKLDTIKKLFHYMSKIL